MLGRTRINKELKILFALMRGELIEPDLTFRSDIFIHLLVRHRMINLVEIPDMLLHKQDLDILKSKGQDFTFRSLSLTRELISLYDTLSAAGLDFILLKGPALSIQLYNDVGKRPFSDLDLLVSSSDFFRVLRSFLELGFKTLYPFIRNRQVYNYYFKHKHDVGLINPETGTIIELHYDINAHRIIGQQLESEFFKQVEFLNILGKPFRILKQEINFLYLCFHGTHHLYFRLFWLKDISLCMDLWNLDHSRVKKIAATNGLERMLAISVLLAREVFGNKIPEEYSLITAGRTVRKLKNICLIRISGPESESFLMKILRHYYFIMLKPGMKYKLYVITSIFHRWYIRNFLGGH